MISGQKKHPKNLNNQGCRVTVVPAGYTAAEVLALKPDGVLLINGPATPRTSPARWRLPATVRAAAIFGICLGHQCWAWRWAPTL
jgi:carbamoyl-phosphate synthase small subunit